MVALLPRGDYKEFLELAKVFLGGSIDRKKGYTYIIQVPGADHHAHWMPKSIYTLKLRSPPATASVFAVRHPLADSKEGKIQSAVLHLNQSLLKCLNNNLSMIYQ